eukprot:1157317-Pelagomonas_calceolata.AAC.9
MEREGLQATGQGSALIVYPFHPFLIPSSKIKCMRAESCGIGNTAVHKSYIAMRYLPLSAQQQR